MREKDVQKVIIDWLRYSGHYCQRINSGMKKTFYTSKKTGISKYGMIRMAEPGTPDIIACINGHFVGIEVKKDEKEVEKWWKKVHKFQQTAYVPPSYKREITQHKQHLKIDKAKGFVLVTGSLNQLEKQLAALEIL